MDAEDALARISELEEALALREQMFEDMVAERTDELRMQHAELEWAMEELRQTQAQLLQASKMDAIGQLAAGIAHEINTPTQYAMDNVRFLQGAMGGILGALDEALALVQAHRAALPADALRRFDDGLAARKLAFLRGEVEPATTQALEGLSRIATIVGAMKAFSHPSQGIKIPIDLPAAINTTLEVCRNEWKYVADVETTFDPDLPQLPCLRDQFNQVVLNLVINAAHAIEERQKRGPNTARGRIQVRTRRAGDRGEIQVVDDGGGIPARIRERIFEPFFTTKDVGRGTGQGLAIVWSVIVDKHGGEVLVDSVEGEGTTFTLLLPLYPDQEDACSG